MSVPTVWFLAATRLTKMANALVWTLLACSFVITAPAKAELINIKLNGPLVYGGDAFGLGISPDSSRVVYTADQDTDNLFNLYSVPVDGSAAPTNLSGLLVNLSNITVQISPDSSRVVYGVVNGGGLRDYYSVPLDGSAPPTKLNGSLRVFKFQISPDSSRGILRVDNPGDVRELYSVPLDGSAAPTKLNGPLVTGGDVGSGVGISPDSSRVIYVSDQDTDGVFELYSVPLDGSAAPTKLNGPLVSGGNVGNFQISPDSSRVVYRADQDTDDVYDLYRVPLDGNVPPTKFNYDVDVSGGDVSSHQISPDSSRVVYRAEHDSIDVIDLYSVPLDGSAAATMLNAYSGTGPSVDNFKISADSSRVAYALYQPTLNHAEVYSVPLDGSAAPTLLIPETGVISAQAGVSRFYQISPDGSRVVYVVPQGFYSIPLDGSAAPTNLTTGFPSPTTIAFKISPDSSEVVYNVDEVGELYRVPLDGNAFPTKVNGPLVAGGRVGGFQISPDSRRVVYGADQDTDNVFELYMSTTTQQQSDEVIDDVGSLLDDGLLNEGQADALIATLSAAQSSMDRGNTRAACRQLQAFINQVNALVAARLLTLTEAQELIDATNVIIEELGC